MRIDLGRELRSGVRALGRNPGYTLAAVLTLALGVGVNTVVFNLFNASLWRDLPIREPARVVDLYTSTVDSPYGSSSYPDYQDYSAQGKEIWSGLMAYTSAGVSFSVDGGAQWTWGTLASGNYFSVLGVEPVLGRSLNVEDDRTGAEPVVVLGHSFWRRHFGESPEAVGKTVRLNGRDFRIVGIAPRGFNGIEMGWDSDFWVPLCHQPVIRPRTRDLFNDRDFGWIAMVGRLRPGVTLQQAQVASATIAARLDQAYPRDESVGPRRGVLASTKPVFPPARVRLETAATYLLVMTGLILLIACVNVANLMLARAFSRRKELAIRLAIGASRSQVGAAFLVESLLLALAGGGLGLLLAVTSSDLSARYIEPVVAGSAGSGPVIGVDRTVFGFGLAVSLLAGFLSGAVATFRSSQVSLVSLLKEGADSVSRGPVRLRLAEVLVVFQVALCFVALVGAGFALHGFRSAQSIDPGFRTENVLLASLDAGQKGYGVAEKRRFYEQLSDRLAALPGIDSVTVTQLAPLSRYAASENVRLYEREDEISVSRALIGPDYFKTLGIPLLRGRELSRNDTELTPGVAVINESMAKRYWPGQDALGKRLVFNRVKEGEAGPIFEIVGIVKDSKYNSLAEEPVPLLYVSYKQRLVSGATVMAHTRGNPLTFVSGFREQLGQLEKDLAFSEIMPLSQHVGAEFAQQRMFAELLSLSGLLALVLAGVGLYGIMSSSVRLRTREIGIRMALGAGRRQVMLNVVGRGITLALAGVVIGLVSATGAQRALAAVLVGAVGTSGITFAWVALVLLSVALLTALVPARRAVDIDPVMAFKKE